MACAAAERLLRPIWPSQWGRDRSFRAVCVAIGSLDAAQRNMSRFGADGQFWRVDGASMAVQDSKRRFALTTGLTGQDGAYLAEYRHRQRHHDRRIRARGRCDR
jgi:hypothetical protein